jgi:hypothetical protein
MDFDGDDGNPMLPGAYVGPLWDHWDLPYSPYYPYNRSIDFDGDEMLTGDNGNPMLPGEYLRYPMQRLYDNLVTAGIGEVGLQDCIPFKKEHEKSSTIPYIEPVD